MKFFDKKILIIFLLIIVAFVAIYFFTKDDDYNLYSNEEFIVNTTMDSAETHVIVVHVDGEVNNPGIVTLNSGSRIADAIIAAGNTTNMADISKINLAYILR